MSQVPAPTPVPGQAVFVRARVHEFHPGGGLMVVECSGLDAATVPVRDVLAVPTLTAEQAADVSDLAKVFEIGNDVAACIGERDYPLIATALRLLASAARIEGEPTP